MSTKTQHIQYEIDSTVDVLTAYFIHDALHPIDTVEKEFLGSHILFQVDSATGELCRLLIYDFSVVRRKLFMRLIFLYTTQAIEYWLNMLKTAFQAGNRRVHA
ncbi:MAG: hypothetical protein GY801_14805 [bacterium]|nr:hypothetical protein [bacterium]